MFLTHLNKTLGIKGVKRVTLHERMTALRRNRWAVSFADLCLLLLGFFLAIPLSYLLLNEWLRNFTYHTSIDAMTYAVSFTILVITVSLTIGYQAVKASVANPVTALRSE